MLVRLVPVNAPTPIEVTELGIVMLVSPLQLPNASSLMDVMEFGMTVFWQPTINELLAVSMMALELLRESYIGLLFATLILVSPLQPENAQLPIEVTELGMSILVSPLQPENADSPIDVTELGMMMLVRLVMPLAKPFGIAGTQSPM